MVVCLKHDEVKLIRPLLDESASEYVDTFPDVKFLDSESIIKKIAERVVSRSSIVLVDNKIKPKGMIVCHIMPSFNSDDVYAAIVYIQVEKDSRRKGIGKNLLGSLPAIVSAFGVTRIIAGCRSIESEGPEGLYRTLGFTELEKTFSLKI